MTWKSALSDHLVLTGIGGGFLCLAIWFLPNAWALVDSPTRFIARAGIGLLLAVSLVTVWLFWRNISHARVTRWIIAPLTIMLFLLIGAFPLYLLGFFLPEEYSGFFKFLVWALLILALIAWGIVFQATFRNRLRVIN